MTAGPSFLVEIALQPEQGVPREDLEQALVSLLRRNPDLGIATDGESGMAMLRAPDEYRLDDGVGALRERCAFAIVAGAPQVLYRETLAASVSVRYVHKQVLGGRGEFALVSFVFEPLPDRLDFVFESSVVPGALSAEFIAAAEAGIRAQMMSGPIAGFPLTGFKARLIDGAYHEMDSSARVFDIAARAALREACVRGAAVLLEPQMRLDIVTPEDFIGGVIGDLNSRGAIYGVRSEPGSDDRMIVAAYAPLANVLFYRRALNSMTEGRADCRVEFEDYVAVERDCDPPRFPSAAAMRVA